MKSRSFSKFIRFSLLLSLLVSTVACRGNEQQQTQQTVTNAQQQPARHKRHHRHQSQQEADSQSSNPTKAIPDYVRTVLTYVRTNHRAPDGYIGGRTFGNYERQLPIQNGLGQRLRYQEWDVKPKIRGQNRGAERLVTSSDDHAYYTRDHYRSFTEIE